MLCGMMIKLLLDSDHRETVEQLDCSGALSCLCEVTLRCDNCGPCGLSPSRATVSWNPDCAGASRLSLACDIACETQSLPCD